jgi:general secretion pathway protein D
MTLAIHFVAATPAESAAHVDVSAMPPAQLRSLVHHTLRRQALAKGPARIAITKELLTLHQQLGANQQMAPAARRQLQGRIGGRLQRAAQQDDYGPELVELIENTIARGSWESQGGLGSIYYWRPGHALAIRQTDEVHRDLADLMGQLRKAGN